MLILRIRQAETAMADGRLDEAFDLARSQDVRAHYRGQQLVGRLARALVERGRAHLDDGRPQDALADSEKAQQLGGHLPEIERLRADVAEAIAVERRRELHRRNIVAEARQHVDDGRLSMGQGLLAEISSQTDRVHELNREAAVRREAAVAAIRRAEAAMEHQDWAAAADELIEARRAHAGNHDVADLTARVMRAMNERIRTAIEQGRLDVAELLTARLEPVADQSIETQELRRIVAQCRLACDHVRRNSLQEACEVIRRLIAIVPGAGWLNEALASAEQTVQGLTKLRGGPLGLLSCSGANENVEDVDRPAPMTEAPRVAHTVTQGMAGARLPRRFIMHVDGVGSFLVIRDRQIRVGPANSSRRPDVGLMIESAAPEFTIERVDDDYFVAAGAPISINNRPTTRKLLAAGDRIGLSPRCRLKFLEPHPASTSAALDIAGTRLPAGDVRRVILFDKSIVVGPGPSAHIRADALGAPVVLSIRDDRLRCTGGVDVMVDERPVDQRVGIPTDRQVRIGPVSFVITAA